jgi:hypothetical protein
MWKHQTQEEGEGSVTASFSLIGTEEAAVKALKERRRSSMGNKKDGEVGLISR